MSVLVSELISEMEVNAEFNALTEAQQIAVMNSAMQQVADLYNAASKNAFASNTLDAAAVIGNYYLTQDGRKAYAASSTGTDAYVVTLAPVPTLVNGMPVLFKADVANTGACTLNVNGLTAAKEIKKYAANTLSSLATNDIAAEQMVLVVWNAAADCWQIVGGVPTVLPTYVDVPLYFPMPSNFAAQSTNYAGLGGATGFAAAESGAPYVPAGITANVVGMLIQCKANTMSDPTVITLQSGNADAASLTASNIVITLAAGVKNGSDFAHTLAITPTKILGLKFVNASGSGSITLIGVTLIVRCPLA